MSWLLCLVVLVSAGHRMTVDAGCSWVEYANMNAPGGTAETVTSLDACKAVCLTKGCMAVDWNSVTKGCWLLYTHEGRKSASGITHYDYACAESQKKDLALNPNFGNCLKTNYIGQESDLFALATGVSWPAEVPSFKVSWPSGAQYHQVTDIKYSTATNLAFIRVKFIGTDGKIQLTEPITTTSYRVQGVDSVKESVIYMAPVDYKQNVSIDGFHIYYCKLSLLGLCTGTTSIFANSGLLGDLLSLVSLGILSFGIGGGVKYSSAQELPYIEVDLRCIQGGPVEFYGTGFGQINNVKYLIVKITDNGYLVPVKDSNGYVTNNFNFAVDPQTNRYGAWFAAGIRGDLIRVTLFPEQTVNQEISVDISLQRFFVLVN